MGFCDDVKAAAEQIAAAPEAAIISHIDADGISCAGDPVAGRVPARDPGQIRFCAPLEPLTMPQVPSDSSLKVFSDLGAGQQNLMLEREFMEKEILIVRPPREPAGGA